MSTIKNQVIRSINIYGLKLQTQLMFGLDTTPEPNETLNELWDIHADSTPEPNDKNIIQYFAIGNKGHRNMTIGDGYSSTEPNQHYTSDAGLFGFIPFIVREIADDLSPAERLLYGMRVPFTKDNIDYVSYYLKTLNLTNTSVEMTQVTNNNGVETVVPFIPNSGNLTPTPPDVPNPGNNSINGDFLFALANIPITLTSLELAEVRAACEIVFGDEAYAVISEVSLVSAARRGVSLLDINRQPTSVNYFEAIQAVCRFFIGGHWPIRFMDELDFTIDGGGGVPLLGPSQTTTVDNP